MRTLITLIIMPVVSDTFNRLPRDAISTRRNQITLKKYKNITAGVVDYCPETQVCFVYADIFYRAMRIHTSAKCKARSCDCTFWWILNTVEKLGNKLYGQLAQHREHRAVIFAMAQHFCNGLHVELNSCC